MSTDNRLLVLIGSGPGIGRAVASRFAQQHFDRIALIARNAQRLKEDRDAVLVVAESAKRDVEVQTWQVDINNVEKLQTALNEISEFGSLECLYFNAARVAGSTLLEFPIEGIEEDLRVSIVALYAATQWAMPILLKKAQSQPKDSKPSLLVTNSLLPMSPIPQVFSLSMVKAAQANLVKSLEKEFSPQGVHVGLVAVGGIVAPDHKAWNPTNVAEQAWKLFAQKPEEWTGQVTIYEDGAVGWTSDYLQ
ncbi:hypothetical protein BJX99DRAFT_57311 [Aspergillus californicus]